jgi:rhodanese-related sulfurtransferase
MTDSISIDPQMTMTRLVESIPGAQRALFRRYHIGGCASCAFEPGETFAALCARNNLDLPEVVAHLQASHQHDEELQISASELAALRKEGNVRLVDIRSREEFEATRIEGAVLLSQPVMQDILAHWQREELLVVYDHRGRQSLDAAAYFMGQGFRKVRCLRGGIDAWSREADAAIPRYRLELST